MKTRSNVVWICSFPTSYRGSSVSRSNAITIAPPPVLEPVLERRNAKELTHQREGFNIQTQVMSTKCQSFPNNLQGAIEATQKCYGVCAPTIFIWCRDYLAEMPLLKRTKGRVTKMSQECQTAYALPNQFNGVTYPTRKRHRFVAPRGRANIMSQKYQRVDALPNQLQGTLT